MRNLVSLLAAEDPTQTHHWLLPETAEIIYGGIASVIVVSLLVKFAGPIAKKALADRTTRIQSDIDNARSSKSAADEEASKIRAALGDISAERARILADADKQAEALLVEGRARLEAEVRDMEAKAKRILLQPRHEVATSCVARSLACPREQLSKLLRRLLMSVLSKTSSNRSFHQ